jgi:hypothetical protein
VGTYTHVLALPCSPAETRRPTVTATVANFGVHRPQRDRYDAADPQSVLGRFLFGFDEDHDARWVTYDPDAVLAVRPDVLRAIATAEASRDEYADWFASQLREADRVLAHAAQRREWVVAVFEGDDACFRRGGVAHHEPGDSMFAPHCTMPEQRWQVVPLGIVGVLVTGLAIAGWRHHRFSRR